MSDGDNQRRTSSREMLRALRAAALIDKDHYPEITEETRKAKRNLLASSAALVLAWTFSVQVNKLPVGGVEISAGSTMFYASLTTGVAYFGLCWVVYFADDYRRWNLPEARLSREQSVVLRRKAILEKAEQDVGRLVNHLQPNSEQASLLEAIKGIILARSSYRSEFTDSWLHEFAQKLVAVGLTPNAIPEIAGGSRDAAYVDLVNKLSAVRSDFLLRWHLNEAQFTGPLERAKSRRVWQLGLIDFVIPVVALLAGIGAGILALSDYEPWWHSGSVPLVPSRGVWGLV